MNQDSQDWFKSSSTISTTLTWACMISLTFLLSTRRSQFILLLSLHSMPHVTCLALVAWSMNTFRLLAIGEKILAILIHYSLMLLVTMWKVIMSQHLIMGSLVLRFQSTSFLFIHSQWGEIPMCIGALVLSCKRYPQWLGCILLSQIIFISVSLSQLWFIFTLSSELHTSCLFSLITPLCQSISITSRCLIPFLSSTSTNMSIIIPTRWWLSIFS